ncbi:mitochondrial hypoxia responsive domain-containing protein [Xylariaceae sp. FL0255]|nr:mitochondrial hypoxia responsive domain-containing protein [Xylariaceae sp. FL0255]
MKVISPEEERAHYNQVLKGGFIGGTAGLGLGLLGVAVASRRYHAFQSLTLPFRAFLVTSTGTFGAIVNAERYSNAYHLANNPMNFYKDQASRDAEVYRNQESSWERFRQFGAQNRYSIVFGSWVAAMGIALGMVGRNKYLTTSQKLVQARVYAQGLTLAVLVASAAFETADAKQGKGRWETIKVLDPNDPEHKHLIEKRIHKEEYEGQDLWRDMVEAEERRIAARKSPAAAGEKSKKATAEKSEEKSEKDKSS